jgi:prepilin-type N-terminal cleavage/methylation domain-containing protein
MKEKNMRTCLNNEKHEAGFTLTELITTIAIIGVLVSIAIPTFSVWLPNYRLRSAARDLYSNLQMAKLGAVKQNKEWAVVFNQGSDRYSVCSDDGVNDLWDGPGGDDDCERTVNLGDYDDVDFGHANINKGVADELFSGGDHIYYANNWVVFGPRGTSEKGYVYVQNTKDTVYGVGTRPSGVIHLKKWTGSVWD